MDELTKLKKRLEELEKAHDARPKPEGAVADKPGVVGARDQ